MTRNSYKVMREQVIEMQRAFANLDKRSKKDKDVQEAIDTLSRARSALEVLWVKTSK